MRSAGAALRLAFASACVAFFGTACGGDGGPAGDGVGAAFTRLTATAESRLGSIDDPDQAFQSIGTVLIGADESLWVTQSLDGQVWVYDAADRLTDRIGGRGEGPGEFSLLGDIGFRGDTLFATDHPSRRMTLFELDGTLIESFMWASPDELQAPDGAGYAATVPSVVLPDGTGLAAPPRTYVPSDDQPDPGVIRRTEYTPVVHLARDGSPIETFWHGTSTTAVGIDVEGTVVRVPCPWAPTSLATLMPDRSGIAVVDWTEPASGGERAPGREMPPGTDTVPADPVIRVTRMDPAGDTLRVDSIPFRPIPVTDEMIREAVEATLAFHRTRGAPTPDPDDVIRRIEAAGCAGSIVSPVAGAIPGQDGSLWMHRPPAAVDPDSLEWIVMESTGKVRGAVRLPRTQIPVTSRGDLLVTRELDELGVSYLTRHRLSR